MSSLLKKAFAGYALSEQSNSIQKLRSRKAAFFENTHRQFRYFRLTSLRMDLHDEDSSIRISRAVMRDIGARVKTVPRLVANRPQPDTVHVTSVPTSTQRDLNCSSVAVRHR